MNSIKTEITVLEDHLKQSNFNVSSVKVLENVGECDWIIKFPQFNDFNVTITLQVPSNNFFLNIN
jgi:hypothetical protein